MKKIKIGFDLDGTLIDSYIPLFKSYRETLKSFGLDGYKLSDSYIKSLIGVNIEKIIEDFKSKFNVSLSIEDVISEFRKNYAKFYLEGTNLIEGVKEVLERLYAFGIGMCIITNKPSFFTIPILEHMEIEYMFDAIVCEDMVLNPKPAKDMFLFLKEYYDVSDDFVYIGDMEIDHQFAKNSGINCLLVSTGSRDLQELRAMGFESVFPNLIEAINSVL